MNLCNVSNFKTSTENLGAEIKSGGFSSVIAVVPPHCFGYCYTTIRYGKIYEKGDGGNSQLGQEAGGRELLLLALLGVGRRRTLRKRQWKLSSKDPEEGKLNCTTPERLPEEDLIQLTNDRTIKRKLRGSKAISSHYSSNAASFAAAACCSIVVKFARKVFFPLAA